MKRLVVITGPTACGKTSISVRLAQHLTTEIVSCDSRQFYKELHIGTAKPTQDDMQGISHHFIGSHSIHEELNAGKYEQLALKKLEQLYKTYETVILTGGSGLFIDAVVYGFDDLPNVKPEIRDKLNVIFEKEGIEPLAKQLLLLDPEYARQVDMNNPKRIIRALEVCLSSGRKYSELRRGVKIPRPFEVIKIVLDWPREKLYKRIHKRVETMIKNGLEEEVHGLIPHKHLNALQTVGYKEFFEYFDGKISRDKAIDLIKQNTRRYAKRQLTWFRRDKTYQWVPATDIERVIKIATV